MPDYERRRKNLLMALQLYREQMGAARRIQHSLRPKLAEKRHRKRSAAAKIIEALRERVQQQKAARTIQNMFRSKASDRFCDYMIAASVASGVDLEDVLSQARIQLEDLDEHDDFIGEEEWLLSNVLEDRAARRIQSLFANLRRQKAADALCDAVLEQASQAGISCEDILRRPSSSVLNDIISRSGSDECDYSELDPSDDGLDDTADKIRAIREQRAGARIMEALQLYRQRLRAAAVIQRHVRHRRPFRRIRARRIIERGVVAYITRRRHYQKLSIQGGA